MVKVGSTKPNLDFAVKEYGIIQPGAAQALGAAWADITGWSITIPKDGYYKIRIDGCFEVDDASANGTMGVSFRLAIGGIGDDFTRKTFYWNGVPNNTDVQQGLEIEISQPFSAGDVITLQGIIDTAGDSAQLYGTASTRIAKMYYELINAYVPTSYASYDTGWVICNDWTDQNLGDIVGGNVNHGLNVPLTDLLVKIYLSSDGTEANAREVYGFLSTGTGCEIQAIDNSSFTVQTGANGINYLDAAGTVTAVPNGWRYRVKAYKLN